jgi:hypothetical protein
MRNITLCLEEELIDRVRMVAAKRKLSVSGLLREELRRLADEEEAYEIAKRSATQRLRRGTHLGGGAMPTRDSLHDRAKLR